MKISKLQLKQMIREELETIEELSGAKLKGRQQWNAQVDALVKAEGGYIPNKDWESVMIVYYNDDLSPEEAAQKYLAQGKGQALKTTLQEDVDDLEYAIDSAWDAMVNGSKNHEGLYDTAKEIDEKDLTALEEKVKSILRNELTTLLVNEDILEE